MTYILIVALLVLGIVLLTRVSNLARKLSDLESRVLRNIEQRISLLESGEQGGQGAKPAKSYPHPPGEQAPSPTVSTEHVEMSLESVAGAKDRPAPQNARSVSPPQPVPPGPGIVTPSRTSAEWEALVGGKILNRIGALAIVLAMAYFMKYAVDQNWIDEAVRVLIGGTVGFGLWGWAYVLHKKDFQVFAQGLVGAGIGVLYLSVYASHNFYSLTSLELAFVLMAFVTALTLYQGVHYNSIAVAVLGWLGGCLTPMILGEDGSHVIGLLSYILLLNAGLLLIVYRKPEWWLLELLTLTGTWVLFLSWYVNFYSSVHLWTAVPFVLLYWGTFFALGIAGDPPGASSRLVRRVVMASNAVVSFTMLYALIDPEHHAWTGLMTLIFAGLYIIPYVAARQSGMRREEERTLYALTSAAFVLMATWIEFDGLDVVILWTIEAAVLCSLAGRVGMRALRISGVSLYFLAFAKFLFTDGAMFYAPLGGFEPLLNERSLALILLGSWMIVSAWESDGRGGEESPGLRGLLYYAGAAMFFTLVALDVNDTFRLRSLSADAETESYFMFARVVWMPVFWSLLSIPFVAVARKFGKRELLIGGLVILSLAGSTIFLRGFLFDPISSFVPLMNIRVFSLAVTIVVCAVHAGYFFRGDSTIDWLPNARRAASVAVMLLLFTLATGETWDYFEWKLAVRVDDIDGESGYLSNLQQLSISGVWLMYSVVLIAVGIWRGLRGVRVAAFVLFGITLLKIFLYDLSYLDTLYRIFLFIGLGIVLLSVSYAYQRFKVLIFGVSVDRE